MRSVTGALMSTVTAGAVLTVVGPLLAQPAQPPAGTFGAALRVEVVNVEAFVTDSGGRPVCGLTAADFELEEDGRTVPLSNFYASGSCEPALDLDVGAATPPIELAEEEALHVVVLIDNLNLAPVDRNTVLDQVEQLLETALRRGDRVMLASFDSSLRERLPFTAEPERVVEGLRELRREAPTLPFTDADRGRVLNDIAAASSASLMTGVRSARPGPTPDQVLQGIESLAEQHLVAQRRLLAGLTRLADDLSGFRGRKVLLLVSNGVPENPCRDLFDKFAEHFPGNARLLTERSRFNLTSELAEVARHANAGRVTYCTVVGKASRGVQGISAEHGETRVSLDAVDELNRTPSMLEFARATGGRSLFNTAALGQALTEVVGELGSSYSLGYQPRHFGDGRYHRLVVRVRRAGVTVRHREGYLDKTTDQRLVDRTAAALLGGLYDNPLGVRLAIGQATRKGKTFTVPLAVVLPMGGLALLPSGELWRGRLSLCLLAADSEGKRADPHRASFPVEIPADRLAATQAGETTLSFTLVLGKGQQRVAVTVRDEVALTDSTVVVAVEDGRAVS